jgi:hypothetical protein
MLPLRHPDGKASTPMGAGMSGFFVTIWPVFPCKNPVFRL